MTRYRWTICALLFIATTINYLDRQVIGLLKDTLAVDFDWSETDYSRIVMAFSVAYAVGLLGFGRLVDRLGTKRGYSFSVFIWSLAAVGHTLAGSTMGFGVARAALGLGEAGNFPAGIKAVAEWFPKKERSIAIGIFNSGTNSASIFGPLMIAWIYGSYGWKMAFLLTGLFGFVWLIFWRIYYDTPSRQKRANQAEVDYIHSDEAETSNEAAVPWRQLLSTRQAWTFIVGKFLTDPIWWFYLFWAPSFFNTTYGLDLSKSAIHVSVIYIMAGIGSVAGGYLPAWLLRRNMEYYRARKFSMLIYALLVIPVIGVQFANGIWTAVALIGLATAAHQAWSANIFTTVSDMFPRKAVSSVVGLGGMAGSVGGILFPFGVGILLDHYRLLGNISAGYNLLFIVCGSTYLIAWVVMYRLSPRMERAAI